MTDFQRYDDEFTELMQQIEDGIEQGTTPYTKNLLQQADDLLKQMSIEARSVSNNPNLKREYMDKVKKLKLDLSTIKTKSEKHGLFGNNNMNNTDQERLLQQQQAEDALIRQNETLERARRTMEETEAVALEITDELGNNREKLMSAHGRVREVTGLTGRARGILTRMNQRAVQQKLIMYGVAIGLIVGFLILLYTMWG